MRSLLLLVFLLVPCVAQAQPSRRAPYDTAALERDVTTRPPAFEACATDQRRRGEPVDGRVRIAVRVNTEASLSPLMIVENTTTNLALADCVGWATRDAYVEVAPAEALTMAFTLTFDARGTTLGTFTHGADPVTTSRTVDASLESADRLARPRPREGEFSSARVNDAMRGIAEPLTRCYESLLADTRTLGGKIVVQFTVRVAGDVHEVVITENTTGSLWLAECVRASVATLHFDPGPEGGEVRYRYPYVFAPDTR